LIDITKFREGDAIDIQQTHAGSMEGLISLRPRLLQSLLVACNSIKVRRLFLYLAEQHQHSWFQRLDIDALDLGTGNRSIITGGHLDSKYLITVPAHFD
jgi:Transcriptional regulator, AbiEi antitoxin, Type IV TA system